MRPSSVKDALSVLRRARPLDFIMGLVEGFSQALPALVMIGIRYRDKD